MSMLILRQYLAIKKRQIYTSKHVLSFNYHISTPLSIFQYFLNKTTNTF